MDLSGYTAGSYPLQSLLHDGPAAQVYATQRDGSPAVVKVSRLNPQTLAARWHDASTLSHPHLIRIFESGLCELNGTAHAYVLMERADEDLSHVDRALTADEGVEILKPTCEALSYLHTHGFAHGGVKPSNIMAFGSTVKLASDTVTHAVEPTEDMRGLGSSLEAVLRENLTGQLREVARRCGSQDPRQRPTPEQAVAMLSLAPAVAKPQPASSRVILGVVAAVALVGGVILWNRTPDAAPTPAPPVAVAQPQPQPQPPADPKPEPPKPEQPRPEPAKPEPPKKELPKQVAPTPQPVAQPLRQDVSQGDVKQVQPAIPDVAMQTINGHVTIQIQVKIDGSGAVTDATKFSKGGSDYFVDFAIKAAKQWQFPASAPGSAIIDFNLTRQGSTSTWRRI